MDVLVERKNLPSVTVDVPDNFTDEELQALPDMEFQSKEEALAEKEGSISQYKPNFYERRIKPVLQELGAVDIPLVQGRTPIAQAFVPKAVEGLSFGLISFDDQRKFEATGEIPDIPKGAIVEAREGNQQDVVITVDDREVSVSQEQFAQSFRRKRSEEGAFLDAFEEHPIASMAGEFTGEIGSLLAIGGALGITKLPKAAAIAGQAGTVIAKQAARFVPRMIMSGSTFGTKAFINETIDQAKANNLDVVELGERVFRETFFGATVGAVSGIAGARKAIVAAGAAGFLLSKSEGGNNQEALLSGAIWMTFELVGARGRDERLLKESFFYLGRSVGDYIKAVNPKQYSTDKARNIGLRYVTSLAQKYGGFDKLAKSHEGSLNFIEEVNQAVRRSLSRVKPAATAERPVSVKIPGPVEPLKTPAGKKKGGIKKTSVTYSEDEKLAIGAVADDIKNIEAFQKTFTPDPESATLKVGVTGFVPDYLKDWKETSTSRQAVTKFRDVPVLEKALKGEPLTIKQKERVDEFISAWVNEQEQITGKSIEELRSGVSEPEATEAIQRAEDDIAFERDTSFDTEAFDAEAAKASVTSVRPPVRKVPVTGIKTLGAKKRVAKQKELKKKQLEQVEAKTAQRQVKDLVRERRIAINLANFETNLFINEIKKDLPKKAEREVIPFIIEGTNVPKALKRPDLEKIYNERKEELEPAAKQIEEHLDEVWQNYKQNMDNMTLEDMENYITHIWEVPKKKRSEINNWFTTQNRFAKKRFIDTYKEGIELGLTPKTLDVADIIRIHDNATNKAIINKQFVDELKKVTEEGLPMVTISNKAPRNWEVYSHPALRQALVIPGKIQRGEKISDELMAVLNELGIAIGRRISPVTFGKPTLAAGLAYTGTRKEIRLQRFFSNATVAHEIGHHLDVMLNLGDAFVKKFRTEIFALNKDRIDAHKGETGKYGQAYVESTEELIAELFAHLFADPKKAMKLAPSASAEVIDRLSQDGVLSRLLDIDFESRAKLLLEEHLDTMVFQPIKVHPDLQKPLDVVFGERFSNPGIDIYESANGILKKLQLSISFFHHLALTETGIPILGVKGVAKIYNPVKVYNALMKNDFAVYENEPLSRHWIGRGLQMGATADIPTKKIQELLDGFAKNTKGIIGAEQITKYLATFNEKWDQALWDYLHDTLKLYGSQALADKIPADISDTEREIKEIEIAQFVNDTFGGQNWDLLYIHPQSLQMMTWSLLSADWTVSTIRQALSPTGLGAINEEGKKFRRKLGGAFWLKAGLYFGLGVNMLNALNRKRDVEKNPQYYEGEDMTGFMDYTMFNNTIGNKTYLFMGRYDDGSERYMRWGKQFRELAEFFFDDTGLSPVTAFLKKIGGKGAPVPQLFSQIFTGHSLSMFKNRDIAGQVGWTKTFGIVKTVMTSPFPFSTRSMMQKGKEFHLTDLAMPSSKGMSKFKTVQLFKVAIERQDERLVREVWHSAHRNNLSANELFRGAMQVLKAEGSREINADIKTVEDAREAFEASDDPAEKAILNRKAKRINKQVLEKKHGIALLEKAIKDMVK